MWDAGRWGHENYVMKEEEMDTGEPCAGAGYCVLYAARLRRTPVVVVAAAVVVCTFCVTEASRAS